MKANVGGIDRILRIVIGLALIALTVTGTIGAWGWIGVVPVLTAALGFCPLYTVLGFQQLPGQSQLSLGSPGHQNAQCPPATTHRPRAPLVTAWAITAAPSRPWRLYNHA
jgi:hypothetical protein